MATKTSPSKTKTVTGLPVNTEAALTYLFGWITGLIFLLLEKDNKKIRFHAMQSIIVFGVCTLATMVPVVSAGCFHRSFGWRLLSYGWF